MKTKTIDVTGDEQRVSGFFQGLGTVQQPIEIVLGGRKVARLIPPQVLSEAEKEKVVQAGWEAVQKARAKNRGVPEREIGKIVDAAVRQVRAKE